MEVVTKSKAEADGKQTEAAFDKLIVHTMATMIWTSFCQQLICPLLALQCMFSLRFPTKSQRHAVLQRGAMRTKNELALWMDGLNAWQYWAHDNSIRSTDELKSAKYTTQFKLAMADELKI